MGGWRVALPIALAAIIAVVGSVLIYNWMQRVAEPEPEITEEKIREQILPTIEVVVATREISAGTRLAPEMLVTREYLEKSLPKGHFTSPEELENRVALAPLQDEEPILEHRLAPKDVHTGGISAVIPQGKRAVAIPGDRVLGVSGFILPGSRVDVMVTWADPEQGQEVTSRVLENIQVLAANTEMQEVDGETTAPVDVYTLEVTPEEAEILIHGRNQGRIQLALRSPVDTGTVLTEGATIKSAMDHLRSKAGKPRRAEAEPATEPSPPAPPPPSTVVEVIRDGRLTDKTFPD